MRRVVVTGIGCVSPLGNTSSDTWTGLLANRSGISHIDSAEGFYDGWENPADLGLSCLIAGNVKGEGRFDANSRQGRATLFALAAAEEAVKGALLEQHFADVPDVRLRTGVALGTGMSSLMDVADATRKLDSGASRRITPFFVPKILCNAAAGQIGIKYSIRGPNHSASTACATGAHGIGDGFRFIQHGDADVMICGGTESCLNPIAFIGFQRAKAMTTEHNDRPEAGSRPFDADRKGFVMAEGAAVMILEEKEHAEARGAPILAEVTGYGVSGDGYHVTSPHPEGIGAQLCMQSALRQTQAALDSAKGEFNATHIRDLAYINAHATSTPTGDDIEARSMETLVKDLSLGTVAVSSTKGHVGHLLGASGAFEALVAVKSLEEGVAPGNLNLESKPETTHITLDADKRSIDQTLAISNSFGFGGTNTCLAFAKLA